MKWMIAIMALVGIAFAGQIVNVGETTDGSSVYSSGEGSSDADCYAEYFQCLRIGCASAGGNFNELNQGCYGGVDAKFAEAVGKCSAAQKDCVMGKVSSPSAPTAATKAGDEEPVCAVGMALFALGLFAIARRG